MQFDTIEVAVDGARGDLMLNRPEKLNPLSSHTLGEIEAAARWFDGFDELKVVVVSGHGRAFSAGADVSSFGSGEAGADGRRSPRDDADSGWRMARAMDEMRAVTVAKVHGWCVGGGLVLAGVCDLRVAARSARFSIPEVELGIPLAWGGIPRLVREIGPALTKELVMTCREFGPDEAKAAGFLNRVVDDDDLDARSTSSSPRSCGCRSWPCWRRRRTPTRSPSRWSGPAAAGPTSTACSPGCATRRAGPRRSGTCTPSAPNGSDQDGITPGCRW